MGHTFSTKLRNDEGGEILADFQFTNSAAVMEFTGTRPSLDNGSDAAQQTTLKNINYKLFSSNEYYYRNDYNLPDQTFKFDIKWQDDQGATLDNAALFKCRITFTTHNFRTLEGSCTRHDSDGNKI